MSLNPAIGDLPRADRPEGNTPASNNFVAERIANHWAELDEHQAPPFAVPEAGPYRGSLAGQRCNRQMYYSLIGAEQSDPPSIADRWRMGLGTTVHTMLQQIAGDLFNDPDTDDYSNAESEVKVDLRPIGVPGSSNLDFLFDYKGRKCAVEIKTVNGFSFKMTATTFKGPAEGPRYGHVLQGALAAAALGAELLVVAYISMENVSPSMAKDYTTSEAGRFAAEWHYTVAELRPAIDAEVARITEVMAMAVTETLPTRTIVDPEYPEGAEINNPEAKRAGWVQLDEAGGIIDSGTTWFCEYCSFRTLCISDGR